MKRRNSLFLIVDDEPDMCWALEHIMKGKGITTCKALKGQDALKLMGRENFHLVFLDAKLPDMEGLELASRIREIDLNIKIVMISGYFYRDDQAIQQALADGLISCFIGKPFQHKEIIDLIDQELSR